MKKVKVELNNKTILVTGSPGFIGANLVLRLLKEMTGGTVISLDNMNDYYDPKIKEYRLGLIENAAKSSPVNHLFIKGSIADKELVGKVFEDYKPSVVVNLAAQAGVRYSIDHPDVYIESNIIGFYNILEACRHNPVEHLVYASSSSVYGPAGRPDMFYYSATQKLVAGKTIQIFNYGNCKRDFTFVDDIVEGVLRVMQGADLFGIPVRLRKRNAQLQRREISAVSRHSAPRSGCGAFEYLC